MSPRVLDALMAALIRLGLLVALVIMLVAEKAQAQPAQLAPLNPIVLSSQMPIPGPSWN